MGWTYTEYRRQPARVVKRWMTLLATESKALAQREEQQRKRSEMMARLRQN